VYPVTFLASGTLTVGANKAHEFPVVFDAGALPTIVSVTTRVKTAPTGQALLVDVNKNGTTIFTTQGNRPSIAAGAKTSAIMVPDVTVLASLDILSVDVDQVGSGVAGADLCVVVLVRQRAVFP
jgi:hypothetical protein